MDTLFTIKLPINVQSLRWYLTIKRLSRERVVKSVYHLTAYPHQRGGKVGLRTRRLLL